jgi:S-adenosylmethionine:tRNA ribosyltransferase-isomerase
MSSTLSDYDYPLPEDLIAQRPLLHREDSRMMVLHRDGEGIEHRQFRELKNCLHHGDLLVLNDTRVVAGRRFSDDGAVEFLFIERLGPTCWRCLVKPGRKMRIGATAKIDNVCLRVEEILPDGERIVSPDKAVDFHCGGLIPLPPYIERPSDLEDEMRYQTTFAQAAGAIAAPTAGLHFTREILSEIPHAFVTLHIGPGTFRPVQSDNILKHKMHPEWFSVSAAAADKINKAKRVVAVGTTAVRVLESAGRKNRKLIAQTGSTDIFIHPPYRFQHVDLLFTNFHLPKSTLLMLVSAFAGREFVLRAYQEATRERYRFYSYGDCMLII